MNTQNIIHDKQYAHSFVISVDTPFGQEDYLLLIDEVSGEAEISTQRGSAKFSTYSIDESSFSACFDIDTPMTTSVSMGFNKMDNSELFAGTVSVGEFVTTTLTAKRHQ